MGSRSKWASRKTALTYIGVVTGVPGDYRLSFPDLPGLSVTAPTLADAIAEGERTLREEVMRRVEWGIEVPFPTLDRPPVAQSEHVGNFTFSVSIPYDAACLRLMIDRDMVRQIDRVADNRNQFIVDAVRSALAAIGPAHALAAEHPKVAGDGSEPIGAVDQGLFRFARSTGGAFVRPHRNPAGLDEMPKATSHESGLDGEGR